MVCIVTICIAGTLMDAHNDCENHMMSEERVLFYAAEIVLALAHIHRMGMIYRDLKPSNVLLCSNGHIQVVDMGGIVDSGGKVLGYVGEYDGIFVDDKPIDDGIDSCESGSVTATARFRGGPIAPVPELEIIDLEGSASRNKARFLALRHTEDASATKRPIRSMSVSRYCDVNSTGKSDNDNDRFDKNDKINKKKNNSKTDANMTRATSIFGTDGYMAPEMLVLGELDGYTNAVDYWSLGVLMFKLLVGSVPFSSNIIGLFMEKVEGASRFDADGNRYYPPSYTAMFKKLLSVPGISPDTVQLIGSFLEVIDMDRLGYGMKGIHRIKHHVGFKNVQWKLLMQKLVDPPFIPTLLPEEFIDSIEPFESFEVMMKDHSRIRWLYMPVTATEQTFFQSW